eukprot:TRINITY_DN7799_c0_g2_i2.p1 TRINITY_DN7799_c0_g2~~TRINITY_DN7799_c0_g2_i2.p1  ORF type:complete len:191 (-),score=-9.50 TRINITY_DN7799_c0_g2_i2:129-701(-)
MLPNLKYFSYNLSQKHSRTPNQKHYSLTSKQFITVNIFIQTIVNSIVPKLFCSYYILNKNLQKCWIDSLDKLQVYLGYNDSNRFQIVFSGLVLNRSLQSKLKTTILYLEQLFRALARPILVVVINIQEMLQNFTRLLLTLFVNLNILKHISAKQPKTKQNRGQLNQHLQQACTCKQTNYQALDLCQIFQV